MNNNLRYIARITIESVSPMTVGSGKKGISIDRLIARDANGLPYIPGTSLAGIIRHELSEQKLDKNLIDKLFGFNDKIGGQGSRIIFSSGLLVSEDGNSVVEGIKDIDFSSGYFSHFVKLPERDHVRITGKGVADTKGHGKFDEEVVFKGSRFCFEIEIEGKEEDLKLWSNILNILHQPYTRIGGGSRKGFGQFKVIECKTKSFNLKKKTELLEYLDKTGSLNADISNWKDYDTGDFNIDTHWVYYKLKLKPENFFLFGSGIGDLNADAGPKVEKIFEWKNGKPELSEAKFLIPGSSVKGALAHRLAYHYNKLIENYIENTGFDSVPDDIRPKKEAILKQFESEFNFTGEDDSKSNIWDSVEESIESVNIKNWLADNTDWKSFERKAEGKRKELKSSVSSSGSLNHAVQELFGFSKEQDNSGSRGNVIVSDVYIDSDEGKTKIFDHLSIDRFTGGGINGALYNEKALSAGEFIIDLFVEKSALSDQLVKNAFENTLKDLTEGRLQLGGNVNRGHGLFTGSFEIKKV